MHTVWLLRLRSATVTRLRSATGGRHCERSEAIAFCMWLYLQFRDLAGKMPSFVLRRNLQEHAQMLPKWGDVQIQLVFVRQKAALFAEQAFTVD